MEGNADGLQQPRNRAKQTLGEREVRARGPGCARRVVMVCDLRVLGEGGMDIPNDSHCIKTNTDVS